MGLPEMQHPILADHDCISVVAYLHVYHTIVLYYPMTIPIKTVLSLVQILPRRSRQLAVSLS